MARRKRHKQGNRGRRSDSARKSPPLSSFNPMTGETLVFAYGSNLSLEQMRRRCPGARLVCAAALFGYAIEFVGYSRRWAGAVANVRPQRYAHVEGLVFALRADDLHALDLCEGHPYVYARRQMVLRSESGADIAAQVYVHGDPRQVHQPSREYLGRIARNYKRQGFAPEALYHAVREIREVV